MTVIRSKTPLKKKLLIISLVLALLWLATEFIFYYPLTGLQLAGKERLKISHGKDEIAIAVTGDIMLGGRMLSFLRSNGYSAPFWYTKKILQEADLAIGNLEGPISETGRRDTRSKTWAYKVSPAAAVALAGAGFGMMTLANNHIRDCGAAGLLETLSFLKKTGIGSAGAGTNTAAAVRPYIRTIRGVRIAVFSFLQPYGNRFNVHYHKSGSGRPGAAIGYLPVVKEALKKYPADIRIGIFHIGNRYESDIHRRYSAYLHRCLDAGFDAIICHGTHVRGPIETRKGKPVYYGIGNFAFGSQNQRARFGLLPVLLCSVKNKRIRRIVVFPLFTNNAAPALWYRTRILKGFQGSCERSSIIDEASVYGSTIIQSNLSLVHRLP